MTPQPPPQLTNWLGHDWTPGLRGNGRPSERAVHGAGDALPGARSGVGRSNRRADLVHPVRRPTRVGCAAGHGSLQLAARHVLRLDRLVREDRGAAGRSAAPARPDGDAAVLRLPHGRLLCPLAQHSGDSFRLSRLPRIFYVNWFRKGDDGRFLWPGYGENIRVLRWILERLDGKAEACSRRSETCPRRGRST